jgi:hypothetical protein
MDLENTTSSTIRSRAQQQQQPQQQQLLQPQGSNLEFSSQTNFRGLNSSTNSSIYSNRLYQSVCKGIILILCLVMFIFIWTQNWLFLKKMKIENVQESEISTPSELDDKSPTINLRKIIPSKEVKFSEEKCLKEWYKVGHMDIENRWQDLGSKGREMLDDLSKNPIWNCRGVTVIPARRWKKSLKRYTFGGFTADLGWPLATSLHVFEDMENSCPDFTNYWGHGCGEDDLVNRALNKGNGSWTCFFEPARDPELAKIDNSKYNPKILIHEDESTRHVVKRREKYDMKNPEHKFRYKKIASMIGLKNSDNDLQSWQAVFHWLFRLKPEVRKRVDERKREILAKGGLEFDQKKRKPYIGVHIRLGDKVGLKDGPLEAHVPYTLEHFARYLLCSYCGDPAKLPIPQTIFVATDDYTAVKNFSRLVGPEFSIFTSADPVAHTGFSITEYQLKWTNDEKFVAAINLWADMEIMAETDRFVGSFQSNIPRMIHLMRMGKPANTTVNMDPIHRSRCSYENEPFRPIEGQLYYCP